MLFDDIQNNSFPEPQSYKASFGKENSSSNTNERSNPCLKKENSETAIIK